MYTYIYIYIHTYIYTYNSPPLDPTPPVFPLQVRSAVLLELSTSDATRKLVDARVDLTTGKAYHPSGIWPTDSAVQVRRSQFFSVYIYIYIHVYIHKHTYIYTYMYIYIYTSG